MESKLKSSLYETFHSSTIVQERIINKNNFTYRIILKILSKHLEKGRLLDIGCGAGTIDFYLGSKGFDVIGIDISEKAIKSAKFTAKKLRLRSLSFEAMNFPEEIPPGRYDSIVCMEVIEHLENDKEAFKKIFGLLKKDGVAILSTPSKTAPVFRLGLANKFDKRVGHLRRYTMGELEILAKLSGFRILHTYKTEGLIRNFLFINPFAGKLLRFIKGPMVSIVSWLDEYSMKLFGESDLFIILQKP